MLSLEEQLLPTVRSWAIGKDGQDIAENQNVYKNFLWAWHRQSKPPRLDRLRPQSPKPTAGSRVAGHRLTTEEPDRLPMFPGGLRAQARGTRA
jgi:hypothetical protein